MARFNRRFEVKRETQDAGKIRPDDKSNSEKEIESDLLEELQKVGFDDEEYEVEEEIEVKLDERGNPVIPEGWTFLTHGSSLDRWDNSLLGNNFVVGNGKVNGQEVKGRPLCCVERNDAKFSYERRGSNTAKAYGGEEQSFEIRVLFYKNPRLGDGKVVRDKLSPDEIKDVSKYYMYQDGRHPAVPVGTKLVFIKRGDFDEITNTDGNNILWYIPEEYLQQYLEDVQQMQEIDEDLVQDKAVEIDRKDEKGTSLTNEDVERELSEYYTDDITNDYLAVYLSEKISQIYGDRLADAGIFNVRKFLDGKLDHFEGPESYKAIVKEIESTLDLAESMHGVKLQEVEQAETIIGEPMQEEMAEKTPKQDGKPALLDKVGDRLDNAISKMDNFEDRMYASIDSIVTRTEGFVKGAFEQILLRAGFNPNCITGIKQTIKSVNPRTLMAMDNILSKTKDKTLTKGGMEDRNEQDYR